MKAVIQYFKSIWNNGKIVKNLVFYDIRRHTNQSRLYLFAGWDTSRHNTFCIYVLTYWSCLNSRIWQNSAKSQKILTGFFWYFA